MKADGSLCHACDRARNPQTHDEIRATLAAGRQAHMEAIQQAIASGFPADELNHGEEVFASVTRQVRTICQTVGTDTPMVLAVLS